MLQQECLVRLPIETAPARIYTSYKVANLPIEFSRSIPRAQLRPGYGDGFRGAPLEDGGVE